MATYCIGDLHGCRDEFLKLLDTIKFNENVDKIILTGDLIGRGPYPVETMQEIFKISKSVTSVLGNHDLNFLAVHYGVIKPRPKDNLEVILKSPHREEIVNFFIKSPILHMSKKRQVIVTHAGIFPMWDIKRAKKEAELVESVIKDPVKRLVLLRNMYSEQPLYYSSDYEGLTRWRFAVNTFTRMRLVYRDFKMDYKNSAVSPESVAQDGLVPWFDVAQPLIYKNTQYTLAFGHWAALNGKCNHKHIRALDTGCIWGDRLTAWRADDDKFFSVKSVGYAKI